MKNHAKVFHEEANIVTPTPGFAKIFHNRLINPKPYKLAIGNNRKLGNAMASWSTLMGNYSYELGETTMKGTCGNHCAGCKHACYVRHSYFQPNVIATHAINTDGMRNNLSKVKADLIKQLQKGNIQIVRINQSGEIENEDQFKMWCDLATMFSNVQFYIYTKNYSVAEHFLTEGLVPKNFTINYSIWHQVGVSEYLRVKDYPSVKAFIYDDGYTAIKSQVSCPAYKKINGKTKLDHSITCEKCGLCFKSSAKTISCVDH